MGETPSALFFWGEAGAEPPWPRNKKRGAKVIAWDFTPQDRVAEVEPRYREFGGEDAARAGLHPL